jgi:hypothetical protein
MLTRRGTRASEAVAGLRRSLRRNKAVPVANQSTVENEIIVDDDENHNVGEHVDNDNVLVERNQFASDEVAATITYLH